MIAHGGNLSQIVEIHGGAPSDWLDLSTGISPFMAELPTFDEDVWRALPDINLLAKVEEKARRFYGTNLECICVPGSQYIIEKLSKIVPGPTSILTPTYGEYEHTYAQNGDEYSCIFSLDEHGNNRSLILANPNNPTGEYHSKSALLNLADRLDQNGKMLVVDEAFSGFYESDSLLNDSKNTSNLLIMRSFGKFFGLAGIRLGFVFASSKVITQLRHMSGPWLVSGPALAIADHLLSQTEYAVELASQIKKRHDIMLSKLAPIGLNISGQCPLFMLVKSYQAKAIFDHLLENQIYVRRFDYNENWLRIGLTKDEQEDQRLFDALSTFQSGM